jgi:hypothetical protein
MTSDGKLPESVEQAIDTFVAAANQAFLTDLVAVVLYGSAAEGRLRTTSDVNMLLVLKRFDQARVDRLREPMRLAHAAVNMNAMFLLEEEVPAAIEAFAVKFADILSRHRVLCGNDPFANLSTPRDALIRRLKQVLLNLQLRLRERYVLTSLREEQLALVVADTAGPLRSSAASLLQLEGNPAPSPKEALARVIQEPQDAHISDALREISVAREEGHLAPGKAAKTLMGLLELIQRMRERVDGLKG